MERVFAINSFVREHLSPDTVIAFDILLKVDLTGVFQVCGISDWETNDKALINCVKEFQGGMGMSFRVKAVTATLIRMKYFDVLVQRNGVSNYQRVELALFHNAPIKTKRVRFAPH